MAIIITILLVFIVLNLLILFFNQNTCKSLNNTNYNSFSIIIASKNEGLNISKLIDSLKQIKYPKENFEVIFVDDNSKDDTKSKILNIDNKSFYYSYIYAKDKKYEGKKGAIDLGIKSSKFENLVITDADCIVNKNWLIELNNCINSGADFIIGISPFYQKNNFINKLSCFENLRTIIITVLSVTINLPFTATARNLCYKKSFYNSINGFNNLQNTLSGDDDLLLKAAIKKKLNIKVMNNKNSFVFSNTKNTFKEFINQKFRHTSTSFYYSFKQSIFPALWHLINLILFLSPILSIIDFIYIIPFFVKLIFDIFVILLKQKKYNYKFGIIEIIYLQFLYELLIIFKFPISYFYKKRW